MKRKNKDSIKIRQEKEQALLLENLKECPVIQVAIKKTGIGRATYYRWKKENLDFSIKCDKAFSEGIEYINDMSESVLISMIKEKKLPAVVFWLRNNHSRYKPKLEIEYDPPSEEKLSIEQKKIITKALSMTKS